MAQRKGIEIMKAMLFAAGLGTRLQPLTNDIPKALAPLQGKTLIEWNLIRLKAAGVHEVIVNVHHFAEKVLDYLDSHSHGLKISYSDEREKLLETGGGLKKAGHFFAGAGNFFVVNADVVCDVNLKELYQQHIRSKAIATLSVMKRESSRYFLFDDEMELCGWENIDSDELKIIRPSPDLHSFAFSGIQVLSEKIFPLIKHVGVFSLVDVYLDLARQNKITGCEHVGRFFDLGTLQKLEKAEQDKDLFADWQTMKS